MNINNKGKGHIAIHNMEFYAFHGVDPIEQKIGRTFNICIDFDYDFEDAAVNDKLEETADYGVIYSITKAEMAATERLLETVVRRIAWRVKKTYPKAKDLKVRLRKMSPFIGGKSMYAEVSYSIE